MSLPELNFWELLITGLGVIMTGACLAILWWQRCQHKYYLVRTIHGDERLHRGKTRVLSCSKCGKVKYE